jgi:hypothetical protein
MPSSLASADVLVPGVSGSMPSRSDALGIQADRAAEGGEAGDYQRVLVANQVAVR